MMLKTHVIRAFCLSALALFSTVSLGRHGELSAHEKKEESVEQAKTRTVELSAKAIRTYLESLTPESFSVYDIKTAERVRKLESKARKLEQDCYSSSWLKTFSAALGGLGLTGLSLIAINYYLHYKNLLKLPNPPQRITSKSFFFIALSETLNSFRHAFSKKPNQQGNSIEMDRIFSLTVLISSSVTLSSFITTIVSHYKKPAQSALNALAKKIQSLPLVEQISFGASH